MQNKEYFTPTIEDFYFGYEFGYQAPDKKWHKVTYHTNDTEKLNFIYIGPKRLQELIDKEQVKVPYLTKEKIEAEGWIFDYNLGDFDYYIKTLNDIEYELEFCYKERININTYKRILYQGECKCINEFRKIIKLLGI